MTGKKGNKVFIVLLVALFSARAFSQQLTPGDSILPSVSGEALLKARLSYSVGSSYIYIPHMGTVTGFTVAPSVSLPLSPKLRLEGGIIAGRFYPSFRGLSPEGLSGYAFNSVSLYASAIYQVSPQLIIYGSGVKQVSGGYQFTMLPKSSYSLGSRYNFGGFSVGVTVQVSDRINYPGTLPFNSPRGLTSPYGLNLPY
jgi:hypothetical protein